MAWQPGETGNFHLEDLNMLTPEMLDVIGEDFDGENEELESISRILKDTFGDDFEQASIHQKLFLLEACCDSMRLGKDWEEAACTWDSDIATLQFPETFEDTQEAMKLIQDLSRAISADTTFHNLPIGGLG